MKFVDIHTHHYQNDTSIIQLVDISDSIEIPQSDHSFLYSLGIHPWKVNPETLDTDIATFKSKLSNLPDLSAIGEVGLDKLKPHFDTQLKVFEEMILISEQMHKPLIIHCVKAFNEIITLNKKHQPKQTWILHGFYSSEVMIKQLLQMNIYFSLNYNSLSRFKNSSALQFIPINRLFLETDDDVHFPIQMVYEKATDLMEIDINILKIELFNNYQTLL